MPPPPADTDPGTPGIQVQIPFFSEPEFLLQAGDETWSLRNRPAGTVAAAYGHTDDAVHGELMSTARVGKLPAGSQQTFGAIAAGRAPLDAAYLGHSDHRGHDWLVTRYDDNSITVTGAMEEALGQRRSWSFGPGADPADASGYVGGWVISDAAFPDPDPDAAEHIPSIALVTPQGTIRRFRMDSTGAWVSGSLNVPGLAAPAVGGGGPHLHLVRSRRAARGRQRLRQRRAMDRHQPPGPHSRHRDDRGGPGRRRHGAPGPPEGPDRRRRHPVGRVERRRDLPEPQGDRWHHTAARRRLVVRRGHGGREPQHSHRSGRGRPDPRLRPARRRPGRDALHRGSPRRCRRTDFRRCAEPRPVQGRGGHLHRLHRALVQPGQRSSTGWGPRRSRRGLRLPWRPAGREPSTCASCSASPTSCALPREPTTSSPTSSRSRNRIFNCKPVQSPRQRRLSQRGPQLGE